MLSPTHKQYFNAIIRLRDLLNLVNNNTPLSDPLSVELIQVSDIIVAYEKVHFPIALPSLIETIELRMFDMKLKQKDLALLLDTTPSRISDYLSGKRQITLDVARLLHTRLHIDSDIILQKFEIKDIP